MPEIATPGRYSLNLPVFQPEPIRLGPAPTPPPIDTSAVSQAGLYGSIAESLGNLPSQLMKAYKDGQQRAMQKQVQGIVSKKMASTDQSGLKYGSDGTVTYAPEDPADKALKKAQIEQSIATAKAHEAYFKGGGAAGHKAPTLYDNLNVEFGGKAPTGTPAGIPVEPSEPLPQAPDLTDFSDTTASVFGRVPDGLGGDKADPNDIADAHVKGFDAKRGAYGYAIQDPKLEAAAVSIDDLKRAGIDYKNHDQVAAHVVQIQGKDGQLHEFPIADLKGGPGTDLTLGAYRKIGGPEEHNGGLVPGLKMRIVPRQAQAAPGLLDSLPVDATNPANYDFPVDNLTAGGGGVAMAPALRPNVDAVKMNIDGSLLPQAAPQINVQPAGVKMGVDGSLSSPGLGSALPDFNPSAPVAKKPALFDQFDPTAPVRKPSMARDPVSGIIQIASPNGDKFQVLPGANKATAIKAPGVVIPATIKAEATRMGINIEGKTLGEVGEAMDEKQIKEGIIPPSKLPVAQGMARMIIGHPTLKHYPTQVEAYELIKSGMANPDAGGFTDMALTEGFQRLVNPGASVKQGTMQQMIKGAGMGQYTDLGFLLDHFKQGDKFSPEARTRLAALADDFFHRSTAHLKPQLEGLKKVAKSYGIKDADSFVSNLMVMTPLYGGDVPAEGAAPGAPAAAPVAPTSPVAHTVKMRDSKSGEEAYVKPEDVEKAKSQGAVLVQ